MPMTPDRSAAWRAILIGGLTGATLDIGYAFLAWGMKGIPPLRILQSVASGWLGKDSFSGGLASAALGAASHYGIVLAAAAIYWLASARLSGLVRQAARCGLAYGLAIYVVMNYVVVPLSAAASRPGLPPWDLLIGGLLIHAFGVGLPIALATRRYRLGPA